MYCPRCGQEQVIEETRYCSKCGFLMTGVSRLIENGGAKPEHLGIDGGKAISARKKGIKQGGILLLSSLFFIPIVAIMTEAFNWDEAIIGVVAVTTFWGGILRMLFARFFESGEPIIENQIVRRPTLFGNIRLPRALPPEQFIPASGFVSSSKSFGRETSDLLPASVTEETTKLLKMNH